MAVLGVVCWLGWSTTLHSGTDAAGQPTAPAVTPDAHATNVRLATLLEQPAAFAGRYVRLSDVEIQALRSPHALIVGVPRGPALPGHQLLVVLPTAATGSMPIGSRIDASGHVYTLAGARRLPEWPGALLPNLTVVDDEQDVVLIAEGLRTRGGLELYTWSRSH